MIRKKLTPQDASLVDDEAQKFGLPDIGIPAEVLFNPELSHTQKILFGFIRNLARSEKGCWASNRYLAACLGLKKQTVTNGVAKLKDLLYVTIEFKKLSNGVQGRVIRINDLYPHIYSAYLKEVYKNLNRGVLNSLYPPIKNFVDPYKKINPKVVSKKGSKKESNNISSFFPSFNGSHSHKKEGVVTSDFAKFWGLYPSKRRGSKGKAITAWEKICKPTYTHRPTWLQIKAAILAQKESPQWLKDKGAYIPLAATWLNNKRWLDDAAELKVYDFGDDNSSSNGHDNEGGWISNLYAQD